MALTNTKYLRWSRVRGWNRTIPSQELPPDLSPSMLDVELVRGGLGRRRRPMTALSLTSGPTGQVWMLATFNTASATKEIWAFSATTSAHRWNGSVWASVSLTDTPASFSATNFVHTAAHNGKWFVAYNSASNRLHLWDGSAMRRVGIGKPSAPTVADTGTGTYATTARYYRVSMRIKSGSDIIAESELSDAVSFTPDGSSEAARVTKPTTVDGATHWVVWGLIGTSGDTYDLYEELAEIAVGTSTYDDSTAPASYDGDFPAPLGMHIPPPSCKLLLSDGNRLLMAGAWESSASTGETAPKSSRVWFTRVLGSSDIGDDETIPNTTTQKNWIDVGENDGDEITAIAGPIMGVVYVFKKSSIWRLIPTGVDTAPYRAERVSSALGAANISSNYARQASIVIAEDQVGQPALYFWFYTRCYRINASGSIDEVSHDLSPPNASTDNLVPLGGVQWSELGCIVWITNSTTQQVLAYTPSLAVRGDDGVLRGGWAPWNPLMHSSGTTFLAATTYPMSGTFDLPVLGGAANAAATIGYFAATYTLATDPGGAFTPAIASKPFLPGGGLNVSCEEPTIEAAADSNASPTVDYIGDFGAQTLTATAPVLAGSGSATRVAKKVEGLFLADARAVQVQVTWDTDQVGISDGVDAVVIPYRVQEPY